MKLRHFGMLSLLMGVLFGSIGFDVANSYAVGIQKVNESSITLDKEKRYGSDPFEGAVYVMTNKREGNSIAAFGRLKNGTLHKIGEFPTGGAGTGRSTLQRWKSRTGSTLSSPRMPWP